MLHLYIRNIHTLYSFAFCLWCLSRLQFLWVKVNFHWNSVQNNTWPVQSEILDVTVMQVIALPHLFKLLTFTGFSAWWKHPIVMVAISAFTVVPARQVNAVSTAVALNKAIWAFINVCLVRTTKKEKIQRGNCYTSLMEQCLWYFCVSQKCFHYGYLNFQNYLQ